MAGSGTGRRISTKLLPGVPVAAPLRSESTIATCPPAAPLLAVNSVVPGRYAMLSPKSPALDVGNVSSELMALDDGPVGISRTYRAWHRHRWIAE